MYNISVILEMDSKITALKNTSLVLCSHSYMEQSPLSSDQQCKKTHLLEINANQTQTGN